MITGKPDMEALVQAMSLTNNILGFERFGALHARIPRSALVP